MLQCLSPDWISHYSVLHFYIRVLHKLAYCICCNVFHQTAYRIIVCCTSIYFTRFHCICCNALHQIAYRECARLLQYILHKIAYRILVCCNSTYCISVYPSPDCISHYRVLHFCLLYKNADCICGNGLHQIAYRIIVCCTSTFLHVYTSKAC
jgi:hypothetical protein